MPHLVVSQNLNSHVSTRSQYQQKSRPVFSLQFFMREMKHDSLIVIHTTRTPILYIDPTFRV